ELIRRQNEQNEDDATAASQREADEVEAAEAPPNVRIILGASPSQPVTVQLHPLGDIKAGAEATSRYRRAVLDVAANASGTALPGALAYQKLFVTQSKENIGFTIQATAYVPPTQARQRIPPKDVAQLLHCTLVFDPAADRIVLRNLDDKSVTLKTLAREKMPAELGLEGKGLSTPRSVQSVEIEPDDFELLEAGPWAIHAASGQEVLEFSILARSGISIIPNPTVPSNAKTTLQGTKRQLASSQAGDPGPSKKGKLREPDKEDK
ncbi:Phosphorylase b kinase gamma catalytic chain, skeletal muscle/heart isoform, partial [Pyricularia oryzae]